MLQTLGMPYKVANIPLDSVIYVTHGGQKHYIVSAQVTTLNPKDAHRYSSATATNLAKMLNRAQSVAEPWLATATPALLSEAVAEYEGGAR